MIKDHKVGVNTLLRYIPEALMANLSIETKVDHYSKVLHGKKMFYLLLYGILENEKLSQRSLEDTFNDPVFKVLFSLDEEESVCRSSISERLSTIDPNFFKQIYDCIYDQFSTLYSSVNQESYNLIRVDSTMVSDTAGKLLEGIDNKSGKKAVKYSVSFDGILPCSFSLFTSQKFASEELALPEVVMNHVKQEPHHQNIYLLDRGLQSTRAMKNFTSNKIVFISRTKENRKYQELESLIHQGQDMDFGDTMLLQDSKVYLYTGKVINNKKGNTHYQQELVKEPFRLIIIQSKKEPNNQFWFITNEFKLSAKEIAQAYRRRWDIEVFFRFIKQELNVRHLLSLNKNGVEVMLYMTLIVAMLILIYKHANSLGYKTAKRRFGMEIRDLVIALIVLKCGGDPNLFFNKT